jgi:hypothetical protein
MAVGSTQPLTGMSTRNLPGGKGRPGRKADDLTAICGSLDVSHPYGPPRTVTGITLLFLRLWPNVGTAGGTEGNIEIPYSGYPVPLARFEQSTIQIRV